MELDELLISTGVDGLIKLLHDKKRVELNAAAKALRMEPAIVEDWAHVLEEDGIIRIEYQFTKVFLIWAAASKEVLEEKLGNIEQRKEKLKESMSSMIKDADEEEKELESLEKDYLELYKTLDPKLLRISEHTEKLKKFEKEEDTIYAKQLEKMEGVRKKLDELTKLMEKVQVLPVSKEKAPEEDMAYLKSYADELKERMKEVDLSFKKISEQIEKEKERLGKAIEAKEVPEEARRMVGEIDLLKKRLEEAEKIGDVAAEARKRIGEMDGLRKRLEEAEKIGDVLLEVKKKIGEMDQLKKKLEEAEKIGEIVVEVRKRAGEMDQLKKRLSEVGRVAPDEKALKDVKAALDQLSLFEKELKNEVGRIRSDADEIQKSISRQAAAYDNLKAARKEKDVAKYIALLDAVRNDYKALSGDIDKATEHVNSAVYSYKEEVGKEVGDVEGTLERLNIALSKKDEVKKITDLISKLKKDEDGIRKELKVLSKEFELLELRVGEGEEMKKKVAGIRERVEITKDEQSKFEEKREELRGLIKKMWEEESS